VRFVLCSFSAVFLTACTVQSKNPDFVNEQSVGDLPSPERELAARIARLRAKAARLSAYRF